MTRESGIYDQWNRETLRNNGISFENEKDLIFNDFKSLKLLNIMPLIYILAFGFALALATLFIEITQIYFIYLDRL